MATAVLPSPGTEVRLRRWNRREYEELIALGVFGPEEHLELVDGEIFEMSPQSSRHATAVRAVEEALRRAFGSGFDVRVQLPLGLDDRSEPEPDVAVVRGSYRDYADAHPRTAVLLVEVSDTTLAYDRGRKRDLYARNGVPEYWILDLAAGALEIHRAPATGRYGEVATVRDDEIVTALAATAPVTLADLLP